MFCLFKLPELVSKQPIPKNKAIIETPNSAKSFFSDILFNSKYNTTVNIYKCIYTKKDRCFFNKFLLKFHKIHELWLKFQHFFVKKLTFLEINP